MKLTQTLLTLLCATLLVAGAGVAQAAFLVQVDTDGLDDGPFTPSPNFSFGGDTTTASTSIAASTPFLPVGDSLFGGDGVNQADTYVATYSPDSEADNLVITPGKNLGEGNIASGKVGGGPALYNVYATWPFTANVSGGLTTYTVTTAGDSDSTLVNQNDDDQLIGGADGRGNVWVLVGQVNYTSGPITVTQEASANSFVSMRAAGYLFEIAIPEPTTAVMSLSGLALVAFRRRR